MCPQLHPICLAAMLPAPTGDSGSSLSAHPRYTFPVLNPFPWGHILDYKVIWASIAKGTCSTLIPKREFQTQKFLQENTVCILH